ncbi:hypothetical protein LEL_06884 [Akanthomyces lecanii RCEF 1005]|uniref:Uncharacterized protein n=1 Tax=Akanthomyces lecanii RCEF 1005 TaxID=1081108 RepID=A0A168FAM1_CORDF|nr:hypothetical protein LEL_06884 [Akanthomyces lecanii RCEF 1005]
MASPVPELSGAPPQLSTAASSSERLKSSTSATPANIMSSLPSQSSETTPELRSSSHSNKPLEEASGARRPRRSRRWVDMTKVACKECRERRSKVQTHGGGKSPCPFTEGSHTLMTFLFLTSAMADRHATVVNQKTYYVSIRPPRANLRANYGRN